MAPIRGPTWFELSQCLAGDLAQVKFPILLAWLVPLAQIDHLGGGRLRLRELLGDPARVRAIEATGGGTPEVYWGCLVPGATLVDADSPRALLDHLAAGGWIYGPYLGVDETFAVVVTAAPDAGNHVRAYGALRELGLPAQRAQAALQRLPCEVAADLAEPTARAALATLRAAGLIAHLRVTAPEGGASLELPGTP
jgi:hypothetical protein